jgi:hypothetical protein
VKRIWREGVIVSLPRFRGHLVYAASAPLRKWASVSFGVL